MSDPARIAGCHGRAKAAGHWIDALLSARGVWLFWLIYGVCFGTIRYLASGNLTLDDAKENELVQWLALGYQTSQPPLFEWILWSVQQLTGAGILSHLLVRYALILAIGVAAFGATRALTRDVRWSAAASISYAFAGFVGWALHEWSTQSVLVSVACLASLHAMLVFLRNPSAWQAILLGLVIGVGLLSKYNYLFYLGGLVLAVVSVREVRGRLVDRYLLLSCLVAAACCAPYVWWLATGHASLVGMPVLAPARSPQPHVVRALLGLGWLALSLAAFLNVWPVMVAMLAWPAFRPARDRRPPAPIPERIAARSIVLATGLTALGIVAIGASHVQLRYLYPLLVTAPVCVFARISRLAPEPRRARRVAVTAVASAALVFGLRLVTFFDTGLSSVLSVYREFAVPYDGLAAELGARGLTDGTLVAFGVREAGNMRAHLPELRVIAGHGSFQGDRSPRRPSDQRRCVLLWKDGEGEPMRSLAQRDLGSATRLDVTTSTIWGLRRGVWYYELIDPRSPICS